MSGTPGESGSSPGTGHVPTANLEIVAHGDIMIQISSSGRLATIKAASQVLCATSSVFRAMLAPSSPFKEARELREGTGSPEPYHLSLMDDNPDALGVILLALHCQNDRVPTVLAFQNIVDLAIVCDKYDCAAGVSQWVDTWVHPWKEHILQKGYEKWLFVAWTFKIGHVFEELSKKFILEGTYSFLSFPGFRTGGGISFGSLLVPDPVMKAIHQKRSEYIKSMSEATRSYRKRYYHLWRKHTCKAPTNNAACDAIILGSMIKGFIALGVAESFDRFELMSIERIYAGLKSLRIEYLPMERCPTCGLGEQCKCFKKTVYDHKKNCDPLPELMAQIGKIYDEVKGLSLDDFKGKEAKTATASWELFKYT